LEPRAQGFGSASGSAQPPDGIGTLIGGILAVETAELLTILLLTNIDTYGNALLMSEMLTSFCARLYSRRSAHNKAKKALPRAQG